MRDNYSLSTETIAAKRSQLVKSIFYNQTVSSRTYQMINILKSNKLENKLLYARFYDRHMAVSDYSLQIYKKRIYKSTYNYLKYCFKERLQFLFFIYDFI